MRTTTILDALSAWAFRQPDSPALQDPARSFTWRSLVEAQDRACRRLVEAGIRPGDRVGVLGPLSVDWAVAGLGVLRAGAVLCPLNERLGAFELTDVVDRLTPALVLAAEQHVTVVEQVGSDKAPAVLPLESFDLHGGVAPLPDLPRDPTAPVCIIPTSGSTGRPKGVVYTHESMLGAFFDWVLQAPELLRGRALNVSAMSFAAGLLNGFLGPLVLGGSVVLLPRWNPQTALELVRDERISTFAATTIFYEQMAALPAFADADLSSLTVAFTGGNPVTPELITAWSAKGVGLRQAYGLTESSSNVTFPTVDLSIRSPESVGQGGILTRVLVTDADGTPCPPGEPGEIRISGPGVAAGYWNDATLTTETFGDGWLRTGDVGVVDEDGALRIVGRTKDMIISGGMNVYAAEVERAAITLPGVLEVAVIGVPDDEFGETPALLLRTAEPVTEEAVLAHCRERLASYKMPRYVVFVEDPLPRTPSMKIDKAAVRRDHADIPVRHVRHGRKPLPA
ncbi:class I adenylate-forming enzyme family protein [Pseudonocardia halophobica]|uniref:class I adenylate-forming enzyme family protein n=1 Tax=Pseudonocardia halophobica TaxID=29401 RepID=UPI003D8D6978